MLEYTPLSLDLAFIASVSIRITMIMRPASSTMYCTGWKVSADIRYPNERGTALMVFPFISLEMPPRAPGMNCINGSIGLSGVRYAAYGVADIAAYAGWGLYTM